MYGKRSCVFNMAYRLIDRCSRAWDGCCYMLHGIDMHRQQVVRICQCQWLKKTSRSTLALSVVSTLCFLDFRMIRMRDLNCWRPKRKNHPLVWINGWSITRMWRRLQRRSSPRRWHWMALGSFKDKENAFSVKGICENMWDISEILVRY